jgi:hypothetical protein
VANRKPLNVSHGRSGCQNKRPAYGGVHQCPLISSIIAGCVLMSHLGFRSSEGVLRSISALRHAMGQRRSYVTKDLLCLAMVQYRLSTGYPDLVSSPGHGFCFCIENMIFHIEIVVVLDH